MLLQVAKSEMLPLANIDVNRADRLGRTVLHLAAQFGFSNFIKELLTTMGADALN